MPELGITGGGNVRQPASFNGMGFQGITAATPSGPGRHEGPSTTSRSRFMMPVPRGMDVLMIAKAEFNGALGL